MVNDRRPEQLDEESTIAVAGRIFLFVIAMLLIFLPIAFFVGDLKKLAFWM